MSDGTRRILIVTADVVTAEDIAEAILLQVPGASVSVRSRVASGSVEGPLYAACLDMRVQDAAAVLGPHPEQPGRVVILADEPAEIAAARARGWKAVLRPCLAEDVAALIAGEP
jgi:hypothetical protein